MSEPTPHEPSVVASGLAERVSAFLVDPRSAEAVALRGRVARREAAADLDPEAFGDEYPIAEVTAAGAPLHEAPFHLLERVAEILVAHADMPATQNVRAPGERLDDVLGALEAYDDSTGTSHLPDALHLVRTAVTVSEAAGLTPVQLGPDTKAHLQARSIHQRAHPPTHPRPDAARKTAAPPSAPER